MQTFREWINGKGVSALHDVLKQREGTIRMWQTRNLIPRAVWPDILIAYPEVGMRDLIDMETRAKGDA